MFAASRKGVLGLVVAGFLTLVVAGTIRADDYEGKVEKITETTITISGRTYGLGGGDGQVHIFIKKSGGSPDYSVAPARVKEYVKVGDRVKGRKISGKDRDQVWYIYTQ